MSLFSRLKDDSERPHISSETPGPGLAILSICSAATSALVAGTIVIYQLRLTHFDRCRALGIKWNLLLGLGLIVSIVQSCITFKQVSYGLGFPIQSVDSHDLSQFERFEYANNLLYIGALFVLKEAQFMLQFSATYPKPNYWIPGIVSAGMVGFLLSAAFPCDPPNFGAVRSRKCNVSTSAECCRVNQTAFWYTFGVFDVVSDVYSVTVVLYATWRLKMRLQLKINLMLILMTKLLPTGCGIARLPFVYAAFKDANYTITSYRLAIPTQLQLHLAVVALSIGKLFRFMNSIHTGYLSSAIIPPRRSDDSRLVLPRPTAGSSLRTNNSDISQSLVPSGYGATRSYAEAVPFEESLAPVRDGVERTHKDVHIKTHIETTEEIAR